MMSELEAPPMTEAATAALRHQVIEAWARVLPESDHSRAFFDQGGNSVRAVTLIMELEARLGVSIPFYVLADGGGVDDIVRWIADNQG